MISASDFLALYPEFLTINTDAADVTSIVTTFLGVTDNTLSDSTWGKGRDYAAGKKITWRDGIAAIYHIIRFKFAD